MLSAINSDIPNKNTIFILNQVFGWVYFIAWSISFYPQCYTNFKRKSIIGLNLDFLTLNITGFFCYSVFNISIFLIYRNQKDHPVEINDIVFSIHAFFLTVFTGIQALIYERGTQKISRINNVILICIALTLGSGVVSLIAKWLSFIHFLYLFSYVKLFVTLIKYIPQAYLNYKRKSTVGWNIWGIILDSTGGIFSFAQMVLLSCSGSKSMSNLNFLSKNSGAVVLNSHTYPACVKEMFISNPVKLMLAAISLSFDIIFYIQHYILYRENNVANNFYQDIRGNITRRELGVNVRDTSHSSQINILDNKNTDAEENSGVK
ncbi:cystinosin homolog [Gordionus sp. m RMFG-2023]|uniref:cystinosin homolog n=1 Tax=Gordionus sp. m RMFG-2023 TaxID=3053472 RepID=UPI0031FC8C66